MLYNYHTFNEIAPVWHFNCFLELLTPVSASIISQGSVLHKCTQLPELSNEIKSLKKLGFA